MDLQINVGGDLLLNGADLQGECCCGCYVTPGLVTYLRNEDFTGADPWVDSQGNYDATNNGVTLVGGFPSFDGIASYLNLGRITEVEGALTEYSISFWVRRTQASTCVISSYDDNDTLSGDGTDSYLSWSSAFNQAKFNRGSNEANAIVVLPLNTWTNIAICNSAIGSTCFENGVNNGFIPGVGVTGGGAFKFRIGFGSNVAYWSDNITEFMLYSRELTDVEVLANYNCTKTIFGL